MGVFLFPIGQRPNGKCTIRVSTFIRHFPTCIRHSVSNAEKVYNTLWAFPKGSPIPFMFCSNCLQELLCALSNVSRHRFAHFLYISIETACFCFFRLKTEQAAEKVKNDQRFVPNYYLSNHTTHSQTQTGATVPLKVLQHDQRCIQQR